MLERLTLRALLRAADHRCQHAWHLLAHAASGQQLCGKLEQDSCGINELKLLSVSDAVLSTSCHKSELLSCIMTICGLAAHLVGPCVEVTQLRLDSRCIWQAQQDGRVAHAQVLPAHTLVLLRTLLQGLEHSEALRPLKFDPGRHQQHQQQQEVWLTAT